MPALTRYQIKRLAKISEHIKKFQEHLRHVRQLADTLCTSDGCYHIKHESWCGGCHFRRQLKSISPLTLVDLTRLVHELDRAAASTPGRDSRELQKFYDNRDEMFHDNNQRRRHKSQAE